MTESEKKELEELRAYKRQHEGKALNRAFARLQQLIDISSHDPAINLRAFRVLSECLICLKEEIGK
jgi:hypothetical protein